MCTENRCIKGLSIAFLMYTLKGCIQQKLFVKKGIKVFS